MSKGSDSLEIRRRAISLKLQKNPIVTVKSDAKCGTYLTASRDLEAGSLVAECSPLSFSLDASWRTKRCGFCSCGRQQSLITMCPDCQTVGACDVCRSNPCQQQSNEEGDTTGMDEHLTECQAFQAARWLCSGDGVLPSIQLLAIRILARINQEDRGSRTLSKQIETLYAAPVPSVVREELKLVWEAIRHIFSHVPLHYEFVIARLLGCGHAMVDPSLPIGNQTIGCALYYEHSFYSHSCEPNTVLSTRFEANCCLITQARTLVATRKDDPIVISYIPLCGLSVSERQERLHRDYHFTCTCSACSSNMIALPSTVDDVDAIRQIQYACNEQLLEEAPHDPSILDEVRGRIVMTQRGIAWQGIPAHHEVSIEAHRLLLHCAVTDTERQKHWDEYRRTVQSAGRLYDQVVFYTECLKIDKTLGMNQLALLLGSDHPWIRSMKAKRQHP